MSKDTVINLRIKQELKDDFQSIISKDGFSMSEVIEACMLDICKRGYIPINVRSKLRPKYQNTLSIPFIKLCLEEILAKNESVKSAYLFGSYSKGKASSSSDVDIYLEADEKFSLFNLTDLQNKLENKLVKKVDLVVNSKDEYFLNHIKKERIQLYER